MVWNEKHSFLLHIQAHGIAFYRMLSITSNCFNLPTFFNSFGFATHKLVYGQAEKQWRWMTFWIHLMQVLKSQAQCDIFEFCLRPCCLNCWMVSHWSGVFSNLLDCEFYITYFFLLIFHSSKSNNVKLWWSRLISNTSHCVTLEAWPLNVAISFNSESNNSRKAILPQKRCAFFIVDNGTQKLLSLK